MPLTPTDPITPRPVEPSQAGLLPCGSTDRYGRLRAGGVTLATLADILATAAGGVVQDRTGLEGEYDVDLEWASDLATSAGVDAASIFTAVQDQLGLRLRSDRIPMPVIVVDRAERPRPD